ncbi:GrpB family protein [Mammaliicoccus lentus]|uniref:GrpB family protein n=1 Tax=Mammaliicoccus lentus TaxID=42858 RepID=UPI00374F0670
MYQFDNLEIDRHLKVRDYLRAHKQEVKSYNKIKEEITKDVDDTKIYRDKKYDYVKKLEERAIEYFK